VIRREAWNGEHGFTIIEVLTTIILMGIVLAIASSTWFEVIESRRVDSATNQLVSDLRLAHSKATNRLLPQTVELSADNSEYVTSTNTRDLDDDPAGDRVSPEEDSTIVFGSDGGAQVTGANPIRVQSTNDTNEFHLIDVNTVTSKIEIDP